jgi:signal peptidase
MRRLANAGLSLLVVGTILMAVAVLVVPTVTGTKAVSITSNSMQAVLPTGSLAFIRSEPTYNVGDVATFTHNGKVISHEIVALLPAQATGLLDHSLFQTKGTSNSQVDPYTIPADAIAGRVVGSIPLVGALSQIAGTLTVQIFLMTLAVGLYLLGQDRRHPLPSPAPEPTPA